MRQGAFHELKLVERALSRRPLSAEQRRRLQPILARLGLRLARRARRVAAR